MRNLILIGLLLSLGAVAVADSTITPTPNDRQAFETGMRQQQAINIFSDPRGCGIVLLRRYCREAFATLGDLSRMPGVKKFVETGNIDAYDKKWADANAVGIADADWKDKPRETWLRAAGVIYSAYYTPDWDAYSMLQVVVFRHLVEYAEDASPYDTLLSESDRKAGPNAIDFQAPARIAKYFVPALRLIFTPEAQPALNITTGPLADAQLGVYASTAQEMFESPIVFLAPTSRAFLKALSIRLGDTELGERFASASNPDEWKTAVAAFQDLQATKLRSLPQKSRDAALFGMFAAQAAYNAAVLRETTPKEQQLAVLQHTADAVPASMRADVKTVLAASDDWHALNAAATTLTLQIVPR